MNNETDLLYIDTISDEAEAIMHLETFHACAIDKNNLFKCNEVKIQTCIGSSILVDLYLMYKENGKSAVYMHIACDYDKNYNILNKTARTIAEYHVPTLKQQIKNQLGQFDKVKFEK